MKWELMKDRVLGVEWRVQANTEDGALMRAIFTGPDAEQRAKMYCHWMNDDEEDRAQEQQSLQDGHNARGSA